MDPTAKSLNAVTNLPKTRSISGNSVPAAMAAMKAMPFSAQLVLSAYLNTRYHASDDVSNRVPSTYQIWAHATLSCILFGIVIDRIEALLVVFALAMWQRPFYL